MYPGFRALICARKAFSEVGDGTRSSKCVRPNSESTLLSVSLPTSGKHKGDYNYIQFLQEPSPLTCFSKQVSASLIQNSNISINVNKSDVVSLLPEAYYMMYF